MVASVWRIVHGYPLYTRPTPAFVPYLYAPLYFYLAAALSKVIVDMLLSDWSPSLESWEAWE